MATDSTTSLRDCDAIGNPPDRLSDATSFLYRFGYLLSMYTGLRAANNRVRHAFLPQLQVAKLSGRKLQLPESDRLKIRVHARVASDAMPSDQQAGMISLTLVSPKIPRPLYALLCMTSHFGCGHIEVAIIEKNGGVVIHGIRNIVAANADRIGCRSFVRKLQLGNDEDEAALLRELSRSLDAVGLTPRFAHPRDCVELSVNHQLLHPSRRGKVRSALRRRYRRIWRKAGVDPDTMTCRASRIS